jgi:hypothetical protein
MGVKLEPKNPPILGIDPGLKGALVLFDGSTLKHWPMPVLTNGKEKEVSFDGIHELLWDVYGEHWDMHIYLERAVAFAMGAKGAFNYGRGYAALEIAIGLLQIPVTYIEPSKWTKVIHAGISADLKPKAKSLIALKRLYPQMVDRLPRTKNGALHDGPVDAFLIAAYGLKSNKT